jgi:hypothetical protein
MARVVYSAEINELTGSVGGTVFQRNNSGTISRLKNVNRGKPTAARQGRNIILNQVVNAWRALTLTQQDAWITFAGTYNKTDYYGKERTITGLNWYIAVNMNRLAAGQSLTATPPANATGYPVEDYTLYVTDTGLELEWSSWPNEADFYVAAFATPPIYSQSLKNRSRIRLIGVYNPNGGHYIDLKSNYESKFGITWPPTATDGSFYVLISLVAISKTTFIAGQFNSVIEPYVVT